MLIGMVEMEKRLTEMGIAVSPATVEICYMKPKGCLSDSLKKAHQKLLFIEWYA